MSNYEVILCYFLFFYGWEELYEQLLLSKSTDFDFSMLFLSLSMLLELLKNTFFFFLCDGIHQSSQDLKLNSWCVKVNDQDQFSPRKSWITRAQQNHSVWFKSVFKKSEKISLQYEVLCNLKWSFQTKKLISLQKKKNAFYYFIW